MNFDWVGYANEKKSTLDDPIYDVRADWPTRKVSFVLSMRNTHILLSALREARQLPSLQGEIEHALFDPEDAG